jgi:hypothetical protein
MGIQGAPNNAETPFLPDRSQAQMLSFLQTFKKELGSVHCPFSPKNFMDLSISI